MNTENSCCEARKHVGESSKGVFDMNSENDWLRLWRHLSRKVTRKVLLILQNQEGTIKVE
ncbi:hypothetical protein KJ836_00225 [Patescibacteria group bacterium]|nr:hypothetical protein [Patescibacteria group bacterium]